MTWLLLGLLLGVMAAGWFGYERQRQVYAQLVAILENDRDAARHEARVFRGLLFPVLNKAEAVSEGAPRATTGTSGEDSATRSGAPSKAAPAPDTAKNSFNRPHLPFRIRFNQARKLSNTKQQKTNTLAAALEQQKVSQEKKS